MVSLNKLSLETWQGDNLEHLRYQYKLQPGEYCLDIGSYNGEWSDEMIRIHKVRVDCFDARDNRAAWMFDGELEMGGQFYYTSMFDKGGLGAVQKYKCVDIAPYVAGQVAVLKMNIEGGEYELLQYIIDIGAMKNIRNLQVQFHLIEGVDCESIYNKLHAQLVKTHTRTWCYPFCWENWTRNEH